MISIVVVAAAVTARTATIVAIAATVTVAATEFAAVAGGAADSHRRAVRGQSEIEFTIEKQNQSSWVRRGMGDDQYLRCGADLPPDPPNKEKNQAHRSHHHPPLGR